MRTTAKPTGLSSIRWQPEQKDFMRSSRCILNHHQGPTASESSFSRRVPLLSDNIGKWPDVELECIVTVEVEDGAVSLWRRTWPRTFRHKVTSKCRTANWILGLSLYDA